MQMTYIYWLMQFSFVSNETENMLLEIFFFFRLNFLYNLLFHVDSYPIFLYEIWKIIYNKW